MHFEQIIQVARNSTCAFNLREASTLLRRCEAGILRLLKKRGYEVKGTLEPGEIIERARQLIGQAKYRRGAKLEEAPNAFDCSSFVIHLYEQAGVWLPRLSIQQSYYSVGHEIRDPLARLQALDIIFTKGWINRYICQPKEGIGHAVLYTGNEFHTVIHAANKRRGIVEDSADNWIKNSAKIVRLIAQPRHWIIVALPQRKKFNSSDDIFWDLTYGL